MRTTVSDGCFVARFGAVQSIHRTIREDSIARAELKKNWAPTEPAFKRFLAWLDQGVESNGETYLEMRRRLELYFERRNCRAPEDLADETLNRVARRLEEEGTIKSDSPAHYCYIVAKLVMHESLRRASAISDLKPDDSAVSRRIHLRGATVEDASEELLASLEQCLDSLAPHDRELIVEYYRGEQRAKIERRRALAARLGLSTNALTIRACRLRDKLETCVKARLSRK